VYHGPVVSLEQVLDSRENRANKQREWVQTHSLPLVSFSINMMGEVKKNTIAQIAFYAGVEAIFSACDDAQLTLIRHESVEADSGYELLAAIYTHDVISLKKRMIAIEEEHTLGRLFDIDVIPQNLQPISRQEVNRSPRRCLVCDSEAKLCARTRAHTKAQLINKMMEMTNDYQ